MPRRPLPGGLLRGTGGTVKYGGGGGEPSGGRRDFHSPLASYGGFVIFSPSPPGPKCREIDMSIRLRSGPSLWRSLIFPAGRTIISLIDPLGRLVHTKKMARPDCTSGLDTLMLMLKEQNEWHTRASRCLVSLPKISQWGKIRKMCPVTSRLNRAACEGGQLSRHRGENSPSPCLAFAHSFPSFPFLSPRTHRYFHLRIPHGGGFPMSTKFLIKNNNNNNRRKNKPSSLGAEKTRVFCKTHKALQPSAAYRGPIVFFNYYYYFVSN